MSPLSSIGKGSGEVTVYVVLRALFPHFFLFLGGRQLCLLMHTQANLSAKYDTIRHDRWIALENDRQAASLI